MALPRIEPGSPRDLGVVNSLISKVAGRRLGHGRPHIFTTLGRNRRLFRAWLFYSAALMPYGKLDRAESELVILHVADHRGSVYEQSHHRRIAASIGMSPEQIDNAHDPDWSGHTNRQQIMLATARAILEQRDLDDAAWTRLRGALSETEVLELLMLITQYDGLAAVLNTLRVQPEDWATQPLTSTAD